MQIDTAIDQLNESVDKGRQECFASIDNLCQLVLTAYIPTANKLRIELDRRTRIPLLAYAWFAAEEAIRKNTPDYVAKGLVALVIEGGRDDLRDNVVRLAVLFHSARILKADVGDMFANIASICSNTSLADEIRIFPFRPAQTRDLPTFLIRESKGPDGFAYEFFGSSLLPKSRRFWPFSRKTRA